MVNKLIMGVLLASVAAVPALAQEAERKKGRDPNRVICRNEEVIGSRLASKRTCLTAAQWDELAREQRQTVERVQIFRAKSN